MKKIDNTIKLRISYQADRENLISALANSGYKVWVEEEYHQQWEGDNVYYICFELKN